MPTTNKSKVKPKNFELQDFDDILLDLESDNILLDFEPETDFNSRFIQPPRPPHISEQFLKYERAEALAAEIQLHRDCRYFVLINGTFYFGDFIEAIIVRYQFRIKKMTIQTLSLNQNNIDSLANLTKGGYVDELNLIVSDFFFAHERQNLIPYIYKELDKKGIFQLAVARTHCKICSFETYDGVYLSIHGSANLRTSDNLEQIVIEDNKALYFWLDEWQSIIIEKYKTINKKPQKNRGLELWQAIN